jgi:hypothetical protein
MAFAIDAFLTHELVFVKSNCLASLLLKLRFWVKICKVAASISLIKSQTASFLDT